VWGVWGCLEVLAVSWVVGSWAFGVLWVSRMVNVPIVYEIIRHRMHAQDVRFGVVGLGFVGA